MCIKDIPSPNFKRLTVKTDTIEASDFEQLIDGILKAKAKELFAVITCQNLEIELKLNQGEIKVVQRDGINMKFDKFRTHQSLRIETEKSRNVVVIYAEKLKPIYI